MNFESVMESPVTPVTAKPLGIATQFVAILQSRQPTISINGFLNGIFSIISPLFCYVLHGWLFTCLTGDEDDVLASGGQEHLITKIGKCLSDC